MVVMYFFSKAGSDYDSVSTDLIFSAESQLLCAQINITSDEVVEEDEVFIIVANTSDSSILIPFLSVNVTIFDSSGEFKKYHTSSLSESNGLQRLQMHYIARA